MQITVNGRHLVLQTLPNGGVGVEIGVHLGNFSAQILNKTQPKKLFLVDPYLHFEGEEYSNAKYGGRINGQDVMDERYAGVKRRFKSHIESGRIVMIREKSVAAAEQFPDESLDFVYVDGDHTYDGVHADIKAYLPKMKLGGLLIGDDYNLGSWWGDSVVKAFAKCLSEDDLKIEFVIDNQICCRKVAFA